MFPFILLFSINNILIFNYHHYSLNINRNDMYIAQICFKLKKLFLFAQKCIDYNYKANVKVYF